MFTGEIEGNLGSIRFLGVLPQFVGVCVGLRLLQKVERTMQQAGCCRSMICVASPKETMQKWIESKFPTQAKKFKFICLQSALSCHDVYFMLNRTSI